MAVYACALGLHPFSLLGACVCYRWANELYGAAAGCLSLVLWCFCPNVLAHAELVTSDVAATALGCAACYAFRTWLRRPGIDTALISGLLLGTAELAKTTWLLLFLLWPLVWAFWRLTSSPIQCRPRPLWDVCGLGGILILGILVLNAGYGFEGSFKALGQYRFVSRVLSGRDAGVPFPIANRFHDSWLAMVPVPLPENYLLGVDQTKAEFAGGMRSYLRGDWKRGGWWYYYLYALAVKVPLGTLALLILAAATRVARCNRRSKVGNRQFIDGASWRDELVLVSPAASVMLLISSQAGSNAMRYILPAFPFVYIWMSGIGTEPRLRRSIAALRYCATTLFRSHAVSGVKASDGLRAAKDGRDESPQSTIVGIAALILLTFSVLSSVSSYPHCLAYFNVLGGGSRGGHLHLLGSNIDWGQDLLYLRDWLNAHPEARPLGLAYFGEN